MADDAPADPVSALMEMASTFHELFVSYTAAGFTDGQALYLVGCTIRKPSEPT